MKKNLLLLYIVFISGLANGQLPSTFMVDCGDSIYLKPIDTSLAVMQRYLPSEQLFLTDLGNPSTPAMPSILPIQVATGFRTGIRPWDSYYSDSKHKTYWKTPKPYTDVRYTQGQGRFLQLDFIFARNITKQWNAGIEIHRLGSKGAYTRQNSDLNDFRMFHQYHSLNGLWQFRYQISLYNKSSQINGGVDSDSLFTASGFFQRTSFPVSLNSSVIWSKSSVQTFEMDYLLRSVRYKGADSTQSPQLPHHLLNLSLSRIRDRNGDSSLTDDFGYYKNIYKDSTRNFDSLTYTNYNATITLRRIDNDSYKKLRFNWSAGLAFDRFFYNDLVSFDISTYNASLKLGGSLLYKGYQIFAKTQLFMAGYNQGDYLVQAGIRKETLNNQWSIELLQQKYLQPFSWGRMLSNHYRWSQTLLPGINRGITGLWSSSNSKIPFNLKFQAGVLQQYVLINSMVFPEQLSNIGHLSMQGSFTLHYKKLYWHQLGFIQRNQSTPALQLPAWGSVSELSLRSRYKKTSLRYQIGLVLDWRQKTQAWSFNPSVMMWAQDSVRFMGGYPMLYFFAAGEIKRFACFIRLEHILYNLHFLSPNLLSYNPLPLAYFASAGNPMQPQIFRFGFRWRFYD